MIEVKSIITIIPCNKFKSQFRFPIAITKQNKSNQTEKKQEGEKKKTNCINLVSN